MNQAFGNYIFPGRLIYEPSMNFASGPQGPGGEKEKERLSMATLPEGGSWNIILADDDEDDREMFAESIAEMQGKIRLECLEDGNSLLTRLHDKAKTLPHIIFLDLNMPQKSGQECLDMIRKDEQLKHIPVVIYSTSSSLKDIDETFAKGANLYIKKPASYRELVIITRRVLSLDWEKYKPHSSRSHFLFSVKPK